MHQQLHLQVNQSTGTQQQMPQQLSQQQQVQLPQVETKPLINSKDPGFAEPREPDRLYARVDTVERTSRVEEVVLFDGVFATWFDRQTGNDGAFPSDIAADAPAAVVELFLDPMDSGSYLEFQVGSWVVVHLSYGDENAAENLYYSLFDEEPVAVAARFERISPELQARLATAFSLDDVADADVAAIEGLLPPEIHTVDVLDVGQGNATALSDEKGDIALYFDFGGGVLANASTFPKNHRGFCLRRELPVVLSHWDWDHWSSGLRAHPHSLDCKWIVPRQPLGVRHKKFAAQLAMGGNLLVWPRNLAEIVARQIRIISCGGTDQNNSGLAMIVSTTLDQHPQRFVLLPGDADYGSIQSGAFGQVHGLIASHHGARVGGTVSSPSPTQGCLVYSYGHGNSFGHPRLHAELAYLTWNWAPDRTLATTQSRRRRPCNVAIHLSSRPTRISCSACAPAFSESI